VAPGGRGPDELVAETDEPRLSADASRRSRNGRSRGRRTGRPRSRRVAPQNNDVAPSLTAFVTTLRLEQPRHHLNEQVEVAGETHHIKAIRRVYKDQAMPITARGSTLDGLRCILVPEPWNEHDPNAVAVLVGVQHVGYIPAELAEDYSPPLLRLASVAALAIGEANIWAKDDGGMMRARVTLWIPQAAAFT